MVVTSAFTANISYLRVHGLLAGPSLMTTLLIAVPVGLVAAITTMVLCCLCCKCGNGGGLFRAKQSVAVEAFTPFPDEEAGIRLNDLEGIEHDHHVCTVCV